jgi:dihydroorotase
MGSSTGNMLVDDPQTLEDIFKYSPTLIAAHCEDEKIIGKNMKAAIAKYGENIPAEAHDSIRSRQACIKSSEKAIGLAEKYGSELHILHISTKEEIEMLRRAALINDKITGEICVHYLIFNRNDYKTYGNKIKCNPALKDEEDMMALRKALKDRTIRVLGTDHAPHLKSEKDRTYKQAPGGLPLIRHSFQIMLELAEKGIFTLGEIADSMSHAPADVFKIKDRGYVREGYYADLVVADLRKKDSESTIKPPYKCGWSPLEGKVFGSSVIHTLVNGTVVVKDGAITGLKNSKRLMFKR